MRKNCLLSVRTSEQARQKVVEINKKIDELEHDREVELQKRKLYDKKMVAEEEKLMPLKKPPRKNVQEMGKVLQHG